MKKYPLTESELWIKNVMKAKKKAIESLRFDQLFEYACFLNLGDLYKAYDYLILKGNITEEEKTYLAEYMQANLEN